ncbi:alpha/beta hydrolase [Erythrobacter sp. GH1-10]|uniref:alpha/beta hydrolase n=1 Tax=Erythrobacter sp. GH1-10 TaxID=3349334 RepID=UPI003877F179
MAIMWFMMPGPPPITVDDPGEGGTRITLNDRPANFFPGKGDGPRPAILMLGGSEGGLRESQNETARRFADLGFSVLYVGYYRTTEETKSFHMVPLETFDAAMEWLLGRDDIDPSRIAMMGTSKGGEGALLYASRNPAISAVVANVPANAVWQGFDWEEFDRSKFESSWSVGGEPVPYLPYVELEWYEWFGLDGVGEMYSLSLDQLPDHPEAAIRVEDIDGPILMLCGEQDSLWPSCRMSRAAQERARAAGKSEVEVIAYEDAGHMMFGKPLDPSDENYENLARMGGTPEGNNEARKQSFPAIAAFLQTALAEGD